MDVKPDTFCLKDIGTFYGGLTGKSGADFGKGNSIYVTFLNVINNVKAKPNLVEFVEIKSGENQNQIQKGDLLFNGSSETPEEVAFPSLVPIELDGALLNSFCFGFRFKDKTRLDPLFFAYYLRSAHGRQFISQLAQGSTRYNISKTALAKIEWNFPDLSEQVVIAEALGDIDELINNSKLLIKKKQKFLDGLLFEVFSGDRKFTSNSVEWKITSFKEVSVIDWGNTNLTKKAYVDGGEFLAVSATGIDGQIDHYEHEAFVPVISAIGALCGKMLLPKKRFVAIKNTITATPKREKADGRFLYYLLRNSNLPIRGGAQPFISKGDIERFEALMPCGGEIEYREQVFVADFLDSFEQEIAELKLELEKYEWLKQGMMNDLLTGKVRLV